MPIVRLIDLKKHRTPNIGKSRYEAIAEYQREYYNRDSELILSDTLQAHPFLSGPEDFCKADNTLSVGPGYVLPKKKNVENGTYRVGTIVSPSKDPADSLRKNKADLIDLKDRRACLIKPAGSSGQGGDRRPERDLQAARRTERPQAAHVDRQDRWPRPSGSSPNMPGWCCGTGDITPEEREQIKVLIPRDSSCSPPRS